MNTQPTSTAAEKIASANVAALLRKLKAGKPLTKAQLEIVQAHTGESEPGKLPHFPSIKSCSASTGIPLAILKQAKANGCPAFRQNNSVSLGEFLRWFFQQAIDNGDLPPGVASWRDALNKFQAQREQIKLAEDRKQVMQFSDAHQQAAEAAAFFFGELDRAERELPPAVKGLDEIEAMQTLKAFFKSVRENARKRFDAIGKVES